MRKEDRDKTVLAHVHDAAGISLTPDTHLDALADAFADAFADATVALRALKHRQIRGANVQPFGS